MAGSIPCFVSCRSSLSAMLETIWMCTHEWSLISRRAVAFTFATCHHALSCVSAFTRETSVRSLRLPRVGTLMRICPAASEGVSRTSRSASGEIGCSMRSSVLRSSAQASRITSPAGAGPYHGAKAALGDLGPVPVERGVEPAAGQELRVRALLDHTALLEHDDQVGVANRREPVGDDEGRAVGE